jgi:hypothetical protein
MLANRTAPDVQPSLERLATEQPAKLRARRTNDLFAGIKLTTARGRRIADLARAYIAALGNPAEIERQAAVIAAAELQVLAEEARTTALKHGVAPDLDQVVRIQGAADRALRRLGVRPGAEPKVPTLAEWAEGVRNAPPSPCEGPGREETGEGTTP